jgi:DNA-binding SARP family transcriptional activator
VPTLLPNGPLQIVYLRTLGHPALLGADGITVHKLRKKDLALLVYLCVEGTAVHSRERLATLLWGESTIELARHSLTQTLSRLGRLLPPGSLVLENQVVHWGEALPCDAVVLLRGGLEPEDVDAGFSIYEGEFLRGFHPGTGAEDFMEWADGRRADLRNAALRLLESAGADAEEKRQWWRAVKLAEKAVRIDPLAENARRRLMRAWAALGERNIARRQFQDFAAWLKQEIGAEPDPETRALANQLRDGADLFHPPPPGDAPGSPVAPSAPHVPAPPLPAPPHTPDSGEVPDPPPVAPAAGVAGEPALIEAPAPGVEESGANVLDADVVPPLRPRGSDAAPAPRRWPRPGGLAWIAAALVLAVALLAVALWSLDPPPPPPPAEQVGHGENVWERGGGELYLAFAETLYAYPDTGTLHACTHRTPAIREVRGMPAWPRRRLPSVRENAWMDGAVPVVSDHPLDKTVFVAMGCVLAGIPSRETLDSIFGAGALERMVEVPQAVIEAMPRAFIARGHPLRPAGTLIRSPDGLLRWITYHGGALAVPDSAVLATHCRTPGEAVDVSEAEFRYYHPFARLHPATGDCSRAD